MNKNWSYNTKYSVWYFKPLQKRTSDFRVTINDENMVTVYQRPETNKPKNFIKPECVVRQRSFSNHSLPDLFNIVEEWLWEKNYWRKPIKIESA